MGRSLELKAGRLIHGTVALAIERLADLWGLPKTETERSLGNNLRRLVS